ncbi:MAG: histidine phosphatase family protein [Leptolyngbyaceae cyanobacterium MO_188.B28]|nr:histidine phosphatase family protein [Leptolyngbyaceae cyanobacterium MO_188.B28]
METPNFLKLLFIRHAQSVGNQQHRMEGDADLGLSQVGKRQAEQLGQRLRREFWRPSHIYCSPLGRAVKTLEILLDPDGLEAEGGGPMALTPLQVEVNVAPMMQVGDDPSPLTLRFASELQEFQNGIFRGLTWVEAQERYPELCNILESSLDWIPIPEAESLQAGRDRAFRFVQHILTRHRNGDCLWIISHSWILEHLIAVLLGCDRTWRIQMPNTALFEFWLDHSRWRQSGQNRFNNELWRIQRFLDCQHLNQI